MTTCVTAAEVYLRMMDPRTLDTIAQHRLPDRVIPPGLTPFEAAGGAYFYLDHRDRAVVSVGRRIFIVALRKGSWRRVRTFDLSGVLARDDQLNSALPDWSGRLWFVSRKHGVVGALDPRSGRVLGSRRTGEAIGNSFAVDDSGGVFVVTDRAQYRFDPGRGGRPRISWRVRYDNVGIKKPGQFDAGSGTTPTLMGRRYLSITDNADPMQVVVLRRARRLRRGQRRRVCEQPVFRKGASATENSIIATGRSMIVENNYGYAPPPLATEDGDTTAPGVTRVDIKAQRPGMPQGVDLARDLAEHGAQAVTGQRPGLPLHQAGRHARSLVPHRRRFLQRPHGLAPPHGHGPAVQRALRGAHHQPQGSALHRGARRHRGAGRRLSLPGLAPQDERERRF